MWVDWEGKWWWVGLKAALGTGENKNTFEGLEDFAFQRVYLVDFHITSGVTEKCDRHPHFFNHSPSLLLWVLPFAWGMGTAWPDHEGASWKREYLPGIVSLWRDFFHGTALRRVKASHVGKQFIWPQNAAAGQLLTSLLPPFVLLLHRETDSFPALV